MLLLALYPGYCISVCLDIVSDFFLTIAYQFLQDLERYDQCPFVSLWRSFHLSFGTQNNGDTNDEFALEIAVTQKNSVFEKPNVSQSYLRYDTAFFAILTPQL